MFIQLVGAQAVSGKNTYMSISLKPHLLSVQTRIHILGHKTDRDTNKWGNPLKHSIDNNTFFESW